MPTPEYVLALREHIGHGHLILPGVTAIVLKDVPPGAPITAVPEVLLVKRADTQEWTPVTGIVDPGEEPHQAGVREVLEETGLQVEAEALLGVGMVGPITYPNQDEASFLDTAIRFQVVGEGSAHPADGENTEVGWFSVMQMPPMKPRFRLLVGDAVAQLRRPEGYRPRMGYHKRDRAR